MFSATVSSTSRLSCCGTTPKCARICGPFTSGSLPRIVRVPDVLTEVAPMMRIVVDLPAPFGPKKPKDSPFATSKSMPSTAMKSPYFLVSPRA